MLYVLKWYILRKQTTEFCFIYSKYSKLRPSKWKGHQGRIWSLPDTKQDQEDTHACNGVGGGDGGWGGWGGGEEGGELTILIMCTWDIWKGAFRNVFYAWCCCPCWMWGVPPVTVCHINTLYHLNMLRNMPDNKVVKQVSNSLDSCHATHFDTWGTQAYELATY